MNKSFFIYFILLFSTFEAKASNVPPVAVVTSTPNQTWFYNLDEVVFSSGSSYDTDGYVNYTQFYINGVLQATATNTGSFSQCFALFGSPTSGCYQLADGVSTVVVGFKVRDNSGDWSTLVTKTYTIQEHKGRKYFVKDHLGNVRVTVNRDGNVLGHDDYYPFGLVMPGRSNNTSNPNDNYKFTGHERDDEAGLTLDYMMARNYDPIIGRFLQIDPLADQFPAWSPYTYAFDNPINFWDPHGMAPCPKGYTCNDPVTSPKLRKPERSNGTINNQGGRFGKTRNYEKKMHRGTDILAKEGTQVNSMLKGTVFATGEGDKNFGNYVIIETEGSDGEKIQTTYAHLSEISVSKDDAIEGGKKVGEAGSTGNAKGTKEPHVHVQVKKIDKDGTKTWVNPEDYMKTEFNKDGNVKEKN